MPIYQFKHPETGEIFEEFRKMKDCAKRFYAPDGVLCVRHWDGDSFQVLDKSRIRLNGDPKKEAEYAKKIKDPERARQMRKKKFGTEGVSITKSPYYHKEKRVKAQGTSQEVDKREFVKSAAQNPNAMKAAVEVLNKKK